MNETHHAGFVYTIEHRDADGRLIERETASNIMPIEGTTYLVGVAFGAQTQIPNWSIGLFSGSYNPWSGDSMSSFPLDATEFIHYSGSSRLPFVTGAPVSGAIDNAANRAEFLITADGSITGGFIASSTGRGATSGILVSAVRFSSPKNVKTGDLLRVLAGFSIVSD